MKYFNEVFSLTRLFQVESMSYSNNYFIINNVKFIEFHVVVRVCI